MNMYLIGVVIAMIVYTVVGIVIGRKVKDINDYYVAGRKAPVILIVGSLVASFLSTGAFLGDTGEVYLGYFMPILIVGVMQGSGYLFGSNLFGRYIRRSAVLTVPEYFGARFNSPAIRKLAGVTTIIGILAYLLSATQGITLLMAEITGMDYRLCVVIAWSTYTIFTIYSGSPGVLVTDTMMFMTFLVAAIVAIPCVAINAGGWMSAVAQLAVHEGTPGIMAWTGNLNYMYPTGTQNIIWGITYGIVWALVVATSPWQTSRYMMAKDEHTVMRSAIFSSIGVIIVTTLLYFTAAFILLLKPGLEGQKALIWAAMNAMPPIVGVVLLTGILAAGISSASTFLSLVGFSLTSDIVPFKDDNDKRMLRLSRYGMLAVSLIVLLLAYFNPPAVFWMMYFGGTVFACSWGPICIASVWSKRLTKTGAFWGMLLGFLSNFLIRMYSSMSGVSLPLYLDSFFVGVFFCALGMVAGSLLTQVTPEEKAQREKLFVIPEGELDEGKMRTTYNMYKLYIVFAVLFTIFLVYAYALPYSRALAAK
ncbi:sodium:proline symporter [Synergistales bacterium]|nr:sodium:proline symporter [Synergistales bacterium]